MDTIELNNPQNPQPSVGQASEVPVENQIQNLQQSSPTDPQIADGQSFHNENVSKKKIVIISLAIILILAVLIVLIFVFSNTGTGSSDVSLNSQQNGNQIINQKDTSEVSEASDTRKENYVSSLSVALIDYYNKNTIYPTSLEELARSEFLTELPSDIAEYTYKTCIDNMAFIVYTKLTNGQYFTFSSVSRSGTQTGQSEPNVEICANGIK